MARPRVSTEEIIRYFRDGIAEADLVSRAMADLRDAHETITAKETKGGDAPSSPSTTLRRSSIQPPQLQQDCGGDESDAVFVEDKRRKFGDRLNGLEQLGFSYAGLARLCDIASRRASQPNAAVNAFAKAILHGDEEHRLWLREAAVAWNAGKSLPPPRGKGMDQPNAAVATEQDRIANYVDGLSYLNARIIASAIRALSPEPTQKPVAWQIFDSYGALFDTVRDPHTANGYRAGGDYVVVPLYTSPPDRTEATCVLAESLPSRSDGRDREVGMTRILAVCLLTLGLSLLVIDLVYVLIIRETGTGPAIIVCGALGVFLAGLGAALLWSSR